MISFAHFQYMFLYADIYPMMCVTSAEYVSYAEQEAGEVGNYKVLSVKTHTHTRERG